MCQVKCGILHSELEKVSHNLIIHQNKVTFCFGHLLQHHSGTIKSFQLNLRTVVGIVWVNPEDYTMHVRLTLASFFKSLQSCLTLCDPADGSPPGSLSLGFSRQEHWSGLPFPSPMHESEKWKGSRSVVSDSLDCSPPGSSVYGIFQARVLEWGATAFSLGSLVNIRKYNNSAGKGKLSMEFLASEDMIM